MTIPPDAQMFLSMTKAALALPILAVTSCQKLTSMLLNELIFKWNNGVLLVCWP